VVDFNIGGAEMVVGGMFSLFSSGSGAVVSSASFLDVDCTAEIVLSSSSSSDTITNFLRYNLLVCSRKQMTRMLTFFGDVTTISSSSLGGESAMSFTSCLEPNSGAEMVRSAEVVLP